MGLISGKGQRVESREKVLHSEDSQAMDSIKELGNRQRDKLLNQDGTEMTVEDYMRVVNDMK